jgi:hypothetical protein
LLAQVAGVLRALLGSPAWFGDVFRVLSTAITVAAASALPSKGGRGSGASEAALASATAAVTVLGCLNSGLRVGARVVTRDTVATSAQASLTKFVPVAAPPSSLPPVLFPSSLAPGINCFVLCHPCMPPSFCPWL